MPEEMMNSELTEKLFSLANVVGQDLASLNIQLFYVVKKMLGVMVNCLHWLAGNFHLVLIWLVELENVQI
jgi:hypothetical protein